MAEQFDLTTPEQPPENTSWKFGSIQLDWDHAIIRIRLKGDNGEVFQHVYKGATATSLMRTLNTADLSTKSLHRRTLEKLESDGLLVGSVSGVPD